MVGVEDVPSQYLMRNVSSIHLLALNNLRLRKDETCKEGAGYVTLD